MRFLSDHDVFAATVTFLRAAGHDVTTAAELGMQQAADVDLLRAAHAAGRLLVTRDRDYGGLVFVRTVGAGVIYLRMSPTAIPAVHAELARLLSLYDEAGLRAAFVVVEPGCHRFRRLANDPSTL